MEIGMIGLGRMGGNMTLRLLKKGHSVVAFDFNQEAVNAAADAGAVASSSLEDMVGRLSAPRAVWVMVPSGDPTEQTINAVAEFLNPGDTIIDGGNSNYHETQRRAATVAERGITMLDCGTSGGVWGLTEGYSLMVGGDATAYKRIEPIFQALAPSETEGVGHVGPAGAGHYVKMIHNGIEYGMMQAFAEGFEILKAKEEFELDLHNVGASGRLAASSAPGCLISPFRPWKRIPAWMRSWATSPTPARVAGRYRRPSTSMCRRTSSRRPSSHDSAPA